MAIPTVLRNTLYRAYSRMTSIDLLHCSALIFFNPETDYAPDLSAICTVHVQLNMKNEAKNLLQNSLKKNIL
jgi:hypothetical protein